MGRFPYLFHCASNPNLLTAAIVPWNTVYLERATNALRKTSHGIDAARFQYLSPLGWEHINLTGGLFVAEQCQDRCWKTSDLCDNRKSLSVRFFPFSEATPGTSRVCPVGIYTPFERHQGLNLALCKTSSLCQGVEGVAICLAAGDRIVERVLRIEGASGSLCKSIAHKRSNRSPARKYLHSGQLPSFRNWHDDDPFHRNLWPSEHME
jgi:hypothetical protein